MFTTVVGIEDDHDLFAVSDEPRDLINHLRRDR